MNEPSTAGGSTTVSPIVQLIGVGSDQQVIGERGDASPVCRKIEEGTDAEGCIFMDVLN
jgi:hypothetical protein